MAIKLLVSGFEASGKSTITAGIENALVFNIDRKEYGFKVPHANITEYAGMNAVLDTISEKIETYQNKFSKLPSTVVFDTVTQLYTAMQGYNSTKYKGLIYKTL